MSKDGSYLAGKADEYLYPALGDPKPPGGADVHLLTEGGIAVRGNWSDDGRFIGWAPFHKRNKEKERQLAQLRERR
jgi:hypothetical protein